LSAAVSSVAPSPMAPKFLTLWQGNPVEGIGGSNDFQQVAAPQRRQGKRRQVLIPIRHGREVVTQWQETVLAAPAEHLAGHADVAREAHGIDEVPAIEAETLVRLVEAVGPDDLRHAGVGRVVFLVAFLLQVFETIRAAEIILGARAADGRKLGVAIEEELHLALAPPAIV